MMNLSAKIYIVVFLFACPFFAFAQPDLPTEEVEVLQNFEATLAETERLEIKPELPGLDTAERKLTYMVPTKTISVEYLPPKIRPIATRGEKVPPAYNGYMKLGFGTPNSPYANLGYQHQLTENFNLGGQVFHHSANRKDLEHQRFSNTFGKVNGKYYFDQGYALTGQMGYEVDEVHYYGYDHETTEYSRDQVQQTFNTFDANFKFFNGERTRGDLNYNAEVDFYSLNDNFASSELGTKLDLGLSKWFNGKHPLSVKIITDFTAFEDTAKQSLHNFFLQPNFTYHGGAFKIKGGINLTSHKDKFRIFPDVEASVRILGNKLTAFGGATGTLRKNDMRTLTDYNPFLLTRFQLRNTELLDFYGGVRGSVRIFDYQVQAGFKNADNLPLYLGARSQLNPVDTLKFAVLYDDVNIIYFKGSVTIRPIKNVEVLASLGQNFYSLDIEDEPWHLPNIEFTGRVNYKTLSEKLILNAELFIQDGVPFKTIDDTTGELNALLDLSVGAEYIISENFGVFANVNNIFNNKRERWHRYDMFGINVMGGLIAKF